MTNAQSQTQCPRLAIAGEVLDLLTDQYGMPIETSFDVLDQLTGCLHEAEAMCSTPVIVAEVLIRALEELVIDIDQAITILHQLTDIPETLALRLLN